LAETLDQQDEGGAVVPALLEGEDALLEFVVVEFVIGFVEFGGIGEGGCVEAGQADGEGFIGCEIGRLFEFAVVDILQFLGGCVEEGLHR
jgi:hypothetical protein